MECLFAWGLVSTTRYQLEVGSAIWTEASSNFEPLSLGFTHEFRHGMGHCSGNVGTCEFEQIVNALPGILQGKEGSGWLNHAALGSFSVV